MSKIRWWLIYAAILILALVLAALLSWLFSPEIPYVIGDLQF